MSKPTNNAESLYAVGLFYLRSRQKDTAVERKKLLSACADADRLIVLCSESSKLYERTLCTEYPSPDWTRLLRVDKQICQLSSRFLINTRYYGWTPLARSILIRHAAIQAAHDEDDPLEMILTANEKKLKQPILEADPLEEVLSIHESTAKGQETSI